MKSLDKLENKLGTQLFLQHICPDTDKITDNFMEVLLGWVNLAAGWPGLVTQWQQPGARAEPATIRQDWELISSFARDPAHI